MTILILNWKDIKNPLSGGAEVVTHEHAKYWVKKGHKVIWFTSSFKNAKRKEIIEGVNIFRFGNIYSIYLFAPIFYLISGNKFDILIDEIHGIPFFTPLYSRKKKVILIHEIAGEIWDKMYPFPVNSLGKLLEKFYLFLYRNETFWTDAESTKHELYKKGIKKITAIACPSTVKPLTKLPRKNKELTFISLTRLVKMKGIEDVIEAFSIIINYRSDSKLLIVGSGSKNYISHLKKIVKTKGIGKNVLFVGFVDEKKKINLLKSSHILLHASIKEGWGINIMEASSLATPAIVYNVPGLRDSVKNNLTGIVVSNNTPKDIANAAINLIDDKNKYREFQKNGLKWVVSLTWESAASKSLKIINDK